MRKILMTLVVKWPGLVGTVATLLAVGLGLAVATQGVTLRGGVGPEAQAGFAVERAFPAVEAPAPPGPIADFRLTDQDGRRVRLREQAGKVLLVNFVTTRCTTTCVQVTRELRGLQEALGGRMGRDVAFLSVGLDPRRDTPAALRRFARRHAVDFRGWAFLSGTLEEVEAARKAFGAVAFKVSAGHGHAGDDLEHTSTTYLVDRQGVVRKKIPPGLLTLAGLHEIQTVLASSR